MKIDRLLAIIIYLLNHKKVSAGKLADHFEVSLRTIYRDIEVINQAGIPVIASAGKNGGFSILETYRMDKNVFSREDFSSIITALKGLNTAFSDKKIEKTIEKMNAILFSSRDTCQNPGHYLFFELSPSGGDEKEVLKLQTIKAGIETSKVLSMGYRDVSGKTTQRLVEPMAMISHGHAWYLYAFCRLREDYRVFRLSRINSVLIKEEAFIRKNIDLESRPWNKAWNEQDSLAISMRFDPKMRYRAVDYFSSDQIEKQPDGSFIVRINFPEDEWVYGFLLSFGDSMEILEPVRIRELIAEKGRRIWEKNKN